LKWFKHDAHSLSKASIEHLIMEFGIEGYGLYYACLELIAGTIDAQNLTFELEHDAKIIAHKFKMDTLKVEQIMHRCIELRLFDLADSGHLRCLTLAKMIDDSTSKNPAFISMQKNLIESGLLDSEKFRKIPKNSEQNRIDKNRIEEKRKEKKNKDISAETLNSFNIFWELYNRKVNKEKALQLWIKIKPELYPVIYEHVKKYRETDSGKNFPYHPNNYLKGEHWNDDLSVFNKSIQTKPQEKSYREQLDERYPLI